MLNKLAYLIGLTLSLVLICYLFYQFYISDGFEYLGKFSLQQYLSSIISIVIYASAVFLLALIWASFFKDKKNKFILLDAYLKTLLWKYIPSNILHFVGRHFYLKQVSKQKTIVLNNVLEVLFVILSSLLLVFLLLLVDKNIMINNDYMTRLEAMLLIVIFYILVGFILFKKNIFTLKKIILTNFYYFGFQLLSALSFVFLWFIFVDNNANLNAYLQIAMIYIVGWLLGFVVVGAPAGIGVREGVYLLLLQPFATSAGLLIAFLLLSRVINVIAEIFLYLVSFFLQGNNNVK